MNRSLEGLLAGFFDDLVSNKKEFLSEEKESKRLLTILGGAHSLNHSLFVIAPPLST